jgi:hypothetical protein
LQGLRAHIARFRFRADLSALRRFVLFVGYPRSGHTLLGALLDTHPNVVIAQELDAFRFMHLGRSRVLALLLERSAAWARNGHQWEGYDYRVPGAWQGRWQQVHVIGDKKGGRTARRILQEPDLLDRFARMIGVPLHLIHHVRNPFDTITTMARRGQPGLEHDVATAIERYFQHAEGVKIALHRAVDMGATHTTVRHEDLVADPRASLAAVWGDLGVTASEELLGECAKRVHDTPRRSREQGGWSDTLREQAQARMAAYPWFQGYTFNG